MTDSNAPLVFISYAREDIGAAKRIHGDLRSAGVRPWLDTEDLRPGENWRLAVPEAIHRSTFFLALLSRNSIAKRGFVQKEQRLALEVVDNLPPRRIFYIPARLEQCEPDDSRVRELNWVDLYPSYEDGMKRLLLALQPETDSQLCKTARCPLCGVEAPSFSRSCEACGTDLGFPNVRLASNQQPELDERYLAALDAARLCGAYDRVLEFATAVKRAQFVLSRSVSGLVHLLREPSATLARYANVVSATGAVSQEGALHRLRKFAEAAMFGFYGDKLLYGVLSLDGQGLREFGPASAVIDEKYISHRSTVTESDSVRMVASRFTTGVVPPGVISTWGEKHKLAVTKLANNIGPTTDADDFARLIRRGSNSDEGFGEFMEVQIYGSISSRAIKHITLCESDLNRADRLLIQALSKESSVPIRIESC